MKRFEKLQRRTNSFLYNHLWLKFIVDYGFALIATLFSAAIFAFAVNVLLQPEVLGLADAPTLVSGGSSGAAQVITKVFGIFNVSIPNNPSLLFSICYIAINVPLIYIAFRYVGKRFAIFTIINVGSVFLLTNVMHGQFFYEIAKFVNKNSGMLGRALFAGMCAGLSSAVAYKIDSSAGGFDIVSYYFSERKSTLAGKYGVIINTVIIAAFSIISSRSNSSIFSSIFFSSFAFTNSLIFIFLFSL